MQIQFWFQVPEVDQTCCSLSELSTKEMRLAKPNVQKTLWDHLLTLQGITIYPVFNDRAFI